MTSDALVNSLFVFMLAGFVGFQVIKRVSPLLHTPLMSLTNALDGIAVVGAICWPGGTRASLHSGWGWLRSSRPRATLWVDSC